MKKIFLLISVLISFAIILPTHAEIVFQEDFESYVDGSNLDGQGGWIGIPDTYPLIVNQGMSVGKGIDSMVANGLIVPPGSSYYGSILSNFSFTLENSQIYTLNYDVFASSSSPWSHNSYLAFSTRAVDEEYSGSTDYLGWGYDGVTYSYYFTTPGIDSPPNFFIYGGVDKIVNLSIVIDPINMESYGLAVVDGEQYETDHRLLPLSYFDSIKNITMFNYRRPTNTVGVQFDNITLEATVVPEPISSILFVTGVATLGFRRFLKKNCLNAENYNLPKKCLNISKPLFFCLLSIVYP